MTIWVNAIVHNEENFLWFAIMSVVDYVDKVLVYDTGSTDKTVEIIRGIRGIKGDKVEFKEVGVVDKDRFPKMRQAMLDESRCDWILVLDGDEIWWEASIKKVINTIQKEGNKIDGIVVPMIVPVGDIYHFQEEKAGQYQLLGRKGHLSLRAINKKIPGLHVDWPYGKESYLDKNNSLIQERENVIFLDSPYLHVTHLKRSTSKRCSNKFKHELGNIKKDFQYPEVFSKRFPSIVSSPWQKIKGVDLLIAKVLTPFRKIKRRIK
ncbi:glycosyltransferase [Candidatus Daviesbacteria bacterium]|nr:glycosyltransferase [Candidatus Daviesbacteria bacterium]